MKPNILFKPLGPQTEPQMSAHDILCIHTMVGYLTSTDGMFRQNGYSGTESHFGIGGIWGSDAGAGYDGDIWQWQDIMHTADANLDGNNVVISCETADNAPKTASSIVRWTDAQARSIVSLFAWLCTKEAHAQCPSSWKCHQVGIPPVMIPDTKPGRRGLAYHQQGIDPVRVAGGVQWSSATGKECPGPVRIKQFKTEIVPAIAAAVNGADVIEQADIDKIAAAVVAKLMATPMSDVHDDVKRPDIRFEVQQERTNRWAYFGARIKPEMFDRLQVALDALAARPVADVDEKALADALIAAGIDGLSDADVARIKTAIASLRIVE